MALILPPGTPLPIVFDPGAADELNVNTGNGYVTHSKLSLDPPNAKPVYASSHDTEGSVPASEAHYDNREIGFSVRCYGTEDEVEDRLNAIYRKLGKIHRQGGTLGITTPAGRTIYFDLVNEGSGATTFDERWLELSKTDIELRLQARPFWRGEETLAASGATDIASTAFPLILDVYGVGGDVSDLGRLVVREVSGQDVWTVIVGVQPGVIDHAEQAGLYLLAPALTPLGTSTNTTLTIRNTDLVPTWQAVLSSDIPESATPLKHTGTFRVWARANRPATNTGAVSIRLEWGEGDYRRSTPNEPVHYAVNDREGVVCWADLGLVHISGDAERWQFRPLVKSTVVGDEIDFTDFMIVPPGIELSALSQVENPSEFTARDEFDQAAGALTGKTLPIGGVWNGAGDTTDFSVSGLVAFRNATGDTDWRFQTANALSAVSEAMTVEIEFGNQAVDADDVDHAVILRWSDPSNYALLLARVESNWGGYQMWIEGKSGGVAFGPLAATIPALVPAAGTFYKLRGEIDASGRVRGWLNASNSPMSPAPQFPVVLDATVAALPAGSPGFAERVIGVVPLRTYPSFFAFVPTPDAALFAGRELELTHQSARRESADGTTTDDVASRRGSFLRLNPGDSRVLVAPFRNEPRTQPNGFSDDIEAELWVTPRGLVVP